MNHGILANPSFNLNILANVDQSITPDVLHSAFLPFGDIVDVSLPKDDRSKDPHRGFGYVEFESPEDAMAAIDNMDQSELYGRILKVSQAKPVKEKSEGLGSKLAVWEQVSKAIYPFRPISL